MVDGGRRPCALGSTKRLHRNNTAIMPAPVIGIDLGTTYARVAVVQHGKVKVITNQHGNRSTPSCVAFTDRVRLIGEEAVSQATHNPENTIFSAKRMIGFSYVDRAEKPELPSQWWPCKTHFVGTTLNVLVAYRGELKPVPPAQVGAMVLTRMKKIAEAYLGQTVTDAVVSVPASFGNAQRLVTKEAAKIAGLEVRRIINEPTAAALAYGLGSKLDREQTVLVFDLGGGTLDVSILTVADGVYQVLSTAGNTCLGGDDFDHRLVQYFSGVFRLKHGMDLSDSPQALCKLRMACEEAKRTLSYHPVAYIKIDSLYKGVSFSGEISRDRFNELCDDLFQDTLGYVRKALEDTKLERSCIDEVILVGGSTRIPKIRQLLRDLFDGKRLNLDVDADEAVVCGAAAHAALLSKDTSLGDDGHVLLEVLSVSLDIGRSPGSVDKLFPRNSRLPGRLEIAFITEFDFQKESRVDVHEGEQNITAENRLLTVAIADGLPVARAGRVLMHVVLNVDLEGLVSINFGQETTYDCEKIRVENVITMGWQELAHLRADVLRMETEADIESRMHEELVHRSEPARQGGEEEEEKEIIVVRDDHGEGVEEEGKCPTVEETIEEEDDDVRNMHVRDEKGGTGCPSGAPSKEVCAVGPSNLRGQPPSDDQPSRRRHDGEPPVEEAVEDVLFVVQALLDAEPRISITERLEIYYRCVTILAQVDTTSRDPRVAHRCSKLHLLLRQLYGDAAGSYDDTTTVPGTEVSSLRERVLIYVRAIISTLCDARDAGDVSQDDVSKVNSMALDLMHWVDNKVNHYAGPYQLLRRIKQLQSTCQAIGGLRIPSDDVHKRSQPMPQDLKRQSEDPDGREDNGRRQDFDDMPPLEEVF